MEFQILGPVRVSDGDRIVDLGSPKQRCVLASLLIRANHAVSIERLVDELWGGEPPDDPLAAIHAYVSRLRRALDPDRRHGGKAGGKDGMLVRAPPGYRLHVDDDHIDARRFERLAEEGRRAQEDGDSESAARLLESALGLWRGDALADLGGYSVARVEATRLEQIRLRAIEELFDALLVLGRHDSVTSEAVTVLAEHPYLERVRGQLMLALYRCDRQVDALSTYREGREIMLEQLGIDPSPALQQLEDDILLQKPHLDWRPTAERSPSTRLPAGSFSSTRGPQRRSKFVGRDTELAVLVDSWHRAAEGARQIVIVSGEPGIGKTRLASELATVARREGGTVLCGGAHLDSVVPYQPFAEALASYAAEASPMELRDAIADDSAILAKLAPGLLARIATRAAPNHADASTGRFPLFDAAAKVLQRLAARAPLLVVLDDLQWADPGSWLLVVHLARLPVDVRLLLVAAVRYPDTDVDHLAMLAGLRRDGAGEINLRGLDERAVGGLITARWGPARADEVRAEIAARSSGNPFYVEQLLAHAEETAARAGSDPEGVEPVAFGVPQGVLDVIGQRVAALSAPARRVLAAASVVGQAFGLDLVGAVMGLGTGELLDHLDEAVAAGLILERPGSIGHYRFAHALTRDALYARFTETRRAHLHQQTGDALEALGHRDQLGELAHHLLLGRADPVRAATYACLAGYRALDQLAHEEAADLFERGLQVLAGGDEGGDIRVDLLLGVVEARGRAGDVTAARHALADATSQARAIDDADRLARCAVATTRGYLTVLPEPEEMHLGLLEEALTRLDDNDSELRAQVLARLAVGLYFNLADRRAVEASSAAVEVARRLGSDDALGHALVSHHLTLQDPAHIADRLEVVAELREVADRLGDVELMVCGRYLPVADHLALADLVAADAAMADCAELLDQTHQPLLRLLPVQHRAMRAILAGHLDEGERLATSALDLAGTAGYHYAQTFGSLIFELRWLQGRLGEIENRLARYAQRQPNFIGWAAALTMTYTEAGRLDEARPRWETIAANGFTDVGFDHTWTTVMVTNAEIAAALHDEPRAATLYRLLLPYHEQLVVLGSGVVCIGALARTLGQLASITGQWDDAEAHFRTSDQINRRVRAAPFVARSQVDHAAMLVTRRGRGDLPRAHTLLAQARSAAQHLDLRGLLPRIEGLVG